VPLDGFRFWWVFVRSFDVYLSVSPETRCVFASAAGCNRLLFAPFHRKPGVCPLANGTSNCVYRLVRVTRGFLSTNRIHRKPGVGAWHRFWRQPRDCSPETRCVTATGRHRRVSVVGALADRLRTILISRRFHRKYGVWVTATVCGPSLHRDWWRTVGWLPPTS